MVILFQIPYIFNYDLTLHGARAGYFSFHKLLARSVDYN